MNRERLLEATVEIVERVGASLRQLRERGVRFGRKPGYELVSEADLLAAERLREALSKLVPDAAWLSEEHVDTGHRLASPCVWIVDPLDGTREFLLGVPEYALSVALVENGQPVLGVVHNPARGHTVAALVPSEAIDVKVDGPVPDRMRVLVGRGEADLDEVPPLPGNVEVQGVGSVAYRLALLAEGSADAVVSHYPRAEWDVAAGAAVCAARGVVVTDYFGRPLRFNKPNPAVAGLLAARPAVHRRLQTYLRLLGR